ncbi:oligosaccharide flippase family protein [Faecalispora anaeroviscerum]|uniref:oligosaccharide flippase family protein n=1 Tax=Faecalispora anaeroviscerum TaxID=2991836 RepID=UPI0024BB837D|nr:oligosaccharide flippase family protein [Faecalispora anaeroviscerum]
MNKRVFLINTLILTAGSLFMRMLNIGFRVFISDRIGAAGLGLYQLIFSVFILAITISTSGISLAVTRLVAEAMAKDDPGYAKGAVRKGIACSLTLSLAAMAALIFLAQPIAEVLLNEPAAARPLQMLAPGLPFMAISASLRGYFIAMRKALRPATAEILEQLATIGITVALFAMLAPQTLEGACLILMLGSTAGEMASCLYNCILYLWDVRRLRRHHSRGKGALWGILRIALPSMTGYTARNILSAVENLLIPTGLRKNGSDALSAMAQYGVIQGMVMPVLFFPAALLSALAALLVPEMAEANASGKSRTIARATGRAMQMTLLFSFLIMGIFLGFSRDIGLTFYKNEQTGILLRILAPLVPLMYLDGIVDSILKGLDQQMSSLKYNLSDSTLRVVLIYSLIPVWGLKGYVAVVFFSTIFNASLSIHRLIKVAQVPIQMIDWVLKPLLCTALSVLLVTLLLRVSPLSLLVPYQCVILQVCVTPPLYAAFLFLCGSLGREDIRWVQSLTGRHSVAAPAAANAD